MPVSQRVVDSLALVLLAERPAGLLAALGSLAARPLEELGSQRAAGHTLEAGLAESLMVYRSLAVAVGNSEVNPARLSAPVRLGNLGRA
jgi:hypothetical protein